ncbi:hypothetical protein B1756_04050 [Natrarchaeobaculum aegyptiacum]|uniref:Uncharacterized protein n=1 Tax=Natrarchaeobaculum aegyptiacum TaxID=745377 RepID=A0A2Z2HPM8_9EURY|nr:hypothetical protein B1756_04050 [Natrarchaeobaculum aegyptiacum]
MVAAEAGTPLEDVVTGLVDVIRTSVAAVCIPIDAVRSPALCGADPIESRLLASELSVMKAVLVACETGVGSACGFVEVRSATEPPGDERAVVAKNDTDCCDL